MKRKIYSIRFNTKEMKEIERAAKKSETLKAVFIREAALNRAKRTR